MYSQLAKLRITIMVSVTTIFGYILYKGTIDREMILPTLGLFLLACGSSVFNHIQEKKSDALMERTKKRPLPSGRLTVLEAVILAILLSFAGVAILYYTAGIIAAALGLLALIWYNGIYTPLKHRNPLAVIPGSLIGAIPPVIGWVAASGYFLDPKILVFAAYFFIWQIPHFWLLLLKYDDDYKRAGIPTLTRFLTQHQLEQITFIWIVATAFFAVSVPYISKLRFGQIHILILAGSLLLIYRSWKMLYHHINSRNYGKTFMSINVYTLFIIIVFAVDKLASH